MLRLSYLKVRERYIADPNEVEVTQLDGTKFSYTAKHILIATVAAGLSVQIFLAREHIDLIKRQNRNRRLSPYEIDKIHSRTFSDWFRERVARLEEQGSVIVTDEIKWLARGPLEIVRNYSGYIVNGVRFHTKKRERCLKTQNSGICVTVKTRSYASSRDKHPKDGEINYYDKGNEQVLEEINDNDLIRPEADDSGDIIEVEINMEDIPPNDEEVETEDESEEDLFS
ncbi:hypothetical protein QL285_048499 [Trifolium repens]|nr:hypothetical protein QL285_048499 [Trifolium repens]